MSTRSVCLCEEDPGIIPANKSCQPDSVCLCEEDRGIIPANKSCQPDQCVCVRRIQG